MSCYAHHPKLSTGLVDFFDMTSGVTIDSNSFYPLSSGDYYDAGYPAPEVGDHIIGTDVYNNEEDVEFVVVSRTFYPKGRQKGYCHIKYNIKRYKEDVKEDL